MYTGLTKKERVILHCDMNNFYASVECMLEPSLKDKCVAVGGSTEDRHGIILAKNYNAKAYNVQTGETIWQAKKKCPDLVVVPPTYGQYLKYSKLAMQIYQRYTDQVEPYGMDECWLDVTGSKIFGDGMAIAEEIRKTITYELGLTVSIGVSFNKVFAKLGSDIKKPDAITAIPKSSFTQIVWPMPVSDLLGVGRATGKIFAKYGILTIGDLANANEHFLRNKLGVNGVKLKQYASGDDYSRVIKSSYSYPVKSIGHGSTATEDLQNSGEVWRVILQLTQDIGTKLRGHKKYAAGVAISIKNNQLQTREWQTKLEQPTQSAHFIARQAHDLFCKNYDWQHEVRAVTVRAISLVESAAPVQFNLFSDINILEKQENLDLAVEKIRKRYGKSAIKHATLCREIKLAKNLDTGVILPTGMLK